MVLVVNTAEFISIIENLHVLSVMDAGRESVSELFPKLLDIIINQHMVEYPLNHTVPYSVFVKHEYMDAFLKGINVQDNVMDYPDVYTFNLADAGNVFYQDCTIPLEYLPYYVIFRLGQFNSHNHQILPFYDYIDKMDIIASYYNVYISNYCHTFMKTRGEYISFGMIANFKHYPLYYA